MSDDITLKLLMRAVTLLLAGMVVIVCCLPGVYRPQDSLGYKIAVRIIGAVGGGMLAVALFMVSLLIWQLWNVAGSL